MVVDDRKIAEAFIRLRSHHLFEAHFCRVRRANEKGHVETLTGYTRRNFLVPVPDVHGGLDVLNSGLDARCRADPQRKLWGKPTIKAELLQQEQPALLPLPSEAFVAARIDLLLLDRCTKQSPRDGRRRKNALLCFKDAALVRVFARNDMG